MIRSLRPEDMAPLKAIHQSLGFAYPFPELRLSDIGKVAANDQGILLGAALAVPIVDCYLLLNRDLKMPPGERLHVLAQLQEAMRADLKERGYRWAQADIPPEIERSFGKRLRQLGWVRSAWPTWAQAI